MQYEATTDQQAEQGLIIAMHKINATCNYNLSQVVDVQTPPRSPNSYINMLNTAKPAVSVRNIRGPKETGITP